MKISKLFHWLYGFVMLLPIFAIGSACLISTFNMASKEESEIHYKYETNDVNSNDDLIIGRVYTFNVNQQMIQSNDFSLTGKFLSVRYFYGSVDDFYIDEVGFIDDLLDRNFSFLLEVNNDLWSFCFYTPDDNSYVAPLLTLSSDLLHLEFDFQLASLNGLPIDIYNHWFSRCVNIPIDYVETHNVSAQDVFYNSVEKVQNMPIFSWAYDSFLVFPFQYILVLFGIPTNHVIVELLSYWLAVSIIWLVFDVIMYVPLLVHRWLDKGVLE